MEEDLEDASLEEVVNVLLPHLAEEERKKIVLYLRSGGVQDAQQMKEEWTTHRLHDELCVPEDVCQVFSDHGLLPPVSLSWLLDNGSIIFEQATQNPSQNLRERFSNVRLSHGAKEVGDFCSIECRSIWEEDVIFHSVRSLLDMITDSGLPVQYQYRMEPPQHKYWFARYATFSFYSSNAQFVDWKLVVTENESKESLLTSFAGLVLAVKQVFREQPGRGTVVSGVYSGWGNQLVICKFRRGQLLPVESTLPWAVTSRVSGVVVLGLKLLIQLLCSPPAAFGSLTND